MASAIFRDALFYGSKYLVYNVLLFGVYFAWIIGSVGLQGVRSPQTIPTDLAGVFSSILLAQLFLISGIMGELFMIIADAVNHGNSDSEKSPSTKEKDSEEVSSDTSSSNTDNQVKENTSSENSTPILFALFLLPFKLIGPLASFIDRRTKKQWEKAHEQHYGEKDEKTNSTGYIEEKHQASTMH